MDGLSDDSPLVGALSLWDRVETMFEGYPILLPLAVGAVVAYFTFTWIVSNNPRSLSSSFGGNALTLWYCSGPSDQKRHLVHVPGHDDLSPGYPGSEIYTGVIQARARLSLFPSVSTKHCYEEESRLSAAPPTSVLAFLKGFRRLRFIFNLLQLTNDEKYCCSLGPG